MSADRGVVVSGKISVAVLLSSYNGEAYIEEQIDSILAQDGDFSLDL